MPGFYDALVSGQQAASTAAPSEDTSQSSEDFGTYIARRAIPFYSAIRNFNETREYTAAQQRISSGQAQSVDQDIVSQYETQQRRDESRGVGGQILSAVANIPALIGETMAGGAVVGRLAPVFATGTSLLARGGRLAATTATAPSFYLQQAAQRAQENGGQWYEPQNLGVAGVMGLAQNAILGSLPNIARGVPGNSAGAMAARLGIRTAAGMGEQQIFDAIGGAVDNILPQAYQTRTRYGLLGDAFRGEWGHFGQHLAVQAVTFATFSALHGLRAEEKPAESPAPAESATIQPSAIPPATTAHLPIPGATTVPIEHALPAAEQAANVRSRMTAARPVEEVPIVRPEINLRTRGNAQEPATEIRPAETKSTETPPEIKSMGDALSDMQYQGITVPMATEKLSAVRDAIYKEIEPGKTATKESLNAAVSKMNLEKAEQKYAEGVIKSLEPYLGTSATAVRDRAEISQANREASGWVTAELAGQKSPLPSQATNRGPRFESMPLPGRSPAAFEPPKGPVVPPEATKAPAKPPEAPVGTSKPTEKPQVQLTAPEKAPPPPRRAVQDALSRHISGDPSGLRDAVKLGNLTPQEAKVFGERLTVGAKPSFDALGAQLGVSRTEAMNYEKEAIRKLGLKTPSLHKAEEAATAGGKQERARASASSVEAKGSGGARRELQERLSDHMGEEIARVEAAGQPVDPVLNHYAELSKNQITKEIVNANQKLLGAAEKPLTPEDHAAISRFVRDKDAGAFNAYLEGRPVEPSPAKRGGTRLATVTGGSAAERASEPITPDRVKAVADLSMHHQAVVKKVQGMILASNVPGDKKVEYMNSQLRILAEMPPTAAALHSASLRSANFHPTTEALGQALAATSPEVRAVLQDGDQVGGAYNRGTGTMTLDGGTKDASGARLAGHETAHAIDGPREVISNSPEVKNAYLKEGLKGIIGEYARTDHHEFFAETLGLVYSGEMTTAQLRDKMPLMYEALVSRDLIRRAEAATGFTKPADVFDRAINDGPNHADTLIRLRTVEGKEETTPEKSMRMADLFTPSVLGGKAKEKAYTFGAATWEAAKGALDHLKQLSGKSFVKTTAIDRLSGEAMGHFASTQAFVQEAVPNFVDLIAGPNATLETRHRQGAAILELSSRHARNRFEEAGHTEKAGNVVTFIAGKELSDPSSPFKSEAEFQQFLKSADGKRAIEAYKEHFVPELESAYRKYKGMAEDEPLKGMAQIPEMPVNFMRLDPEKPSDSPFYIGGRGNLKNPKMSKLVFDQSATRAHPAYETDIAKILDNSLGKTVSLANKKAMYDRLIAAGLAEKGPSGGRGQLANGDKVWEIPNVYSDRHSLYASERVAPELRQLLAVDKPLHIPLVTDAAKILNRAMGAALAEPVSHLKNMLTSLTGAGVNPLEMIPNAYKIIAGDVGIKKQILELAKINAFRGHGGLESGQLWGGKTDPTHWLGKLINVMDSAARLTLKSAYERNVRMGRTEATETGLRDFVNQGLGDYNKLSQHRLIAVLRDTGLGPFATAGTKYYMSAMRLLTLDPGFKATTNAHAFLARAEVIGRLVAVASVVALANTVLWKKALGDDDTPFGAIKTGTTADGKTTHFDLMAFTGLTRGMRQTGLLALAEGIRQGSSPQRIGDRGMDAFYTSLLHPAEGPVVNFAHTLISGRDTFGRSVLPPESAGGSRALESGRAALIQANPLTAAVLGHDKRAEDMTYGARAVALLGPFNPFRERGDQNLAEMHGRLRELEDQRRAFLTQPDNIARPFAREAEYRVLKRFDEAVGKLNDALQGTARAQSGTRQIARPDVARIRELREQVAELATRAMRTQQNYR